MLFPHSKGQRHMSTGKNTGVYIDEVNKCMFLPQNILLLTVFQLERELVLFLSAVEEPHHRSKDASMSFPCVSH